jgi:hypothetical protein
MAVRRHIGPVMVMMTMMAVDLHLSPTYVIVLTLSIGRYPDQFLAVSVATVPGSRITSISL